MVQWLAPIALFWTLAALWLGGAALRIEGGRGIQHVVGLLLTFALFLSVWAAARAALSALGATTAVVVAILVATVLLPVLAWIGFRASGVRISRIAAPSHG